MSAGWGCSRSAWPGSSVAWPAFLIAPSNPLSFYSDLPLALSGFAAAVFGGLTSPLRTLFGGLCLGIAGQLTAGYLNGSYQTEMALLLMLVIMIVRSSAFVQEEVK